MKLENILNEASREKSEVPGPDATQTSEGSSKRDGKQPADDNPDPPPPPVLSRRNSAHSPTSQPRPAPPSAHTSRPPSQPQAPFALVQQVQPTHEFVPGPLHAPQPYYPHHLQHQGHFPPLQPIQIPQWTAPHHGHHPSLTPGPSPTATAPEHRHRRNSSVYSPYQRPRGGSVGHLGPVPAASAHLPPPATVTFARGGFEDKTSDGSQRKRSKAPNSTWTMEDDNKLLDLVLSTLPRQDYAEYARLLNKRDSQTVRYRWKVLVRRARGEGEQQQQQQTER
ncbi:hypothetical protein CJU89_0530 [Yarrowia sp. B02]|nr:hypothetical protein CJU89_0530 [Yarrowia sp. B02]